MALVSLSVTAAAVLSGCSADADGNSGTDGGGQPQAAARPKGVVTVDVARATIAFADRRAIRSDRELGLGVA